MALKLYKNISTTVGDLLRALLYGDSFLVTSLDSEENTARYVRQQPGFEELSSLEGRALLDAAAMRSLCLMPGVFTKFDEVWIFERVPSCLPPDEVSLIEPLDLEASDIRLAELYMREQGAIAVFGDGLNTNALIRDDWAERISHTLRLDELS